MPKKYNWDFVEDFENEKALDLYLLTQVQTSTEHSNINNCSICTSEHKMNYKIRVCTSTECNTIKPCIFKYKILKCCRTGKIKLYSLNSHNILRRAKTDKHHGLTSVLKEIVEKLLFEQNVKRPKKIMIELTSMEIQADSMPTVEQIINYLRYRRLKLGDNNNMEGVESFVRSHTYEENYDPNKLFVFGVRLGKGSDDDHFYLGFTTINLLKRIEYSNKLYHIDATYKILKYLFPLIIFGFTDISRKFYVVAYMFVSHEQEVDYKHFFTSLLKLTVDLNIHLDVEYLVQDAWTATSNAVSEVFDDVIIVMCWFHVMFNFELSS